MAVTLLSGLGEVTTNFLLNDFDVYIMNTSATAHYEAADWALLGFTSAEKTINPVNEKYVREGKIPRVPTYTKTIRAGLEISFALSNQNPKLEAILKQGTYTNLGTGTGERIDYGTSQATQEYRCIRFATTLDNGTKYTLTIPKCELMQNGEKTVGGETEVVTPIMAKAYYNPNAPAATRNLYYEKYLPSSVSVTADTAFGY
jgi:hypothetical protein